MCHSLTGDSNDNKPAVGAEEEEVAKMGCPSLGEHTKLEVVIEESYEFKVSPTVRVNDTAFVILLLCSIPASLFPWLQLRCGRSARVR